MAQYTYVMTYIVHTVYTTHTYKQLLHVNEKNKTYELSESVGSDKKRFTSFKICRCADILEIVHVNDIYNGRDNSSLILQKNTSKQNDVKLGSTLTLTVSLDTSLDNSYVKDMRTHPKADNQNTS